MQVTVIYANPATQFIKKLDVPKSSTVRDVIEISNILILHPEISLEKNEVGIFNMVVSLDRFVNENDRIEIYRQLTMDPTEARRLRAKATV